MPPTARDASDVLGAQLNHSIHSADRATHLKIVAMALVAGIAVSTFGLATRTHVGETQTAGVLKASQSMVLTSAGSVTIR